MLFYSEFKIQIYNPNLNLYQDPLYVSKHLLDSRKQNEIVVFLWDPVSEDSDWTSILKSNYLLTEEQIKEYKNSKQNQKEQILNQQQQSGDIIEINENNVCPVSCKFTNVQEELVESHLILFDPYYLDKDNWKRIPLSLPEKHPHQKFGLMHYKAKSEYSILNSDSYNNLMDLRISYYNSTFKDLDITLACPPNSSYSIKNTMDLLLNKHSDDDFIKRKSMVFISSNCNDGLSSIRTKLVEIMSKKLQIESLGSCLANTNLVIKKKSQIKNLYERIQYNMNIYKQYKFVICFENDNSTNYITEKVFTALYAGAIPIYMGTKDISNWVPSGSIINLNDFKTIDQVIKYIKDIKDGKVDYKRFFEWKEKGELEPKVIDKLERCINSINTKCKICQELSKHLTKADRDYRLSTMSVDHSFSHYTPLYLEMKGLGDHILVQQDNSPCKGSLNLQDHYTLMAWVRPLSFGDQRILDKNQAGKIDGFNFDIQKTESGRGVVRLCAGDNCFESHNSISNDLWYHVAVVFDCNNFDVHKNRVRFYINGNKDAVYDNFTPTKKNRHPLVIGRTSNGPDSHSFHGKLDNIMIFNKSLSQQDIKQLIWDKPSLDYNIVGFEGQTDKPLSISEEKLKRFKIYQNLVLYYDFDNNPSHDKTDRLFIKDQSLCGNHGRLSKGPREDFPEKFASISKEYTFNKFL
ncbi:hypothetical protein DICPUDRAFT_27418 [Dictyostelium purpureum]|uniref:Fucosyltransferase n=1 Tax=Dictyostelium purpureum TaxID=5786 RepID=F0ZA70_DICPU|nr:uncharacterized protein DICPUDRAFT_27418 [Dictyostelium purpureum]EGC39149.1 hypothetical protein DICPUDRAFT_27418 [Dictyostelium purpureum]|eukprot:XP_003284295.1 hypothetical protein DICPUDRAFT_27418 [Dictyostelium purpureum]